MNRHLKNRIVITFLSTVLLFVVLLHYSCNKKEEVGGQSPCANVVCYNDGSCIDGKCNCISGFEGDHCEINSRDRFVGSWAMTEKIIGSSISSKINTTRNYTLTIKKSDVTKLALGFDNLAGESTYNNVLAYAGMRYDYNAKSYVIDEKTKFCFSADTYIQGTTSAINGGSGKVNDLSTFINGIYYLQYIVNGKVAYDTVSFSGEQQ